MDIEQRVAGLERSARAWRAAALGLLVAVPLLAMRGPAPQMIDRAVFRSLMVRSEDGKRIITLSCEGDDLFITAEQNGLPIFGVIAAEGRAGMFSGDLATIVSPEGQADQVIVGGFTFINRGMVVTPINEADRSNALQQLKAPEPRD